MTHNGNVYYVKLHSRDIWKFLIGHDSFLIIQSNTVLFMQWWVKCLLQGHAARCTQNKWEGSGWVRDVKNFFLSHYLKIWALADGSAKLLMFKNMITVTKVVCSLCCSLFFVN